MKAFQITYTDPKTSLPQRALVLARDVVEAAKKLCLGGTGIQQSDIRTVDEIVAARIIV